MPEIRKVVVLRPILLNLFINHQVVCVNLTNFNDCLQCPDHGINRLLERLLLFRHDYSVPNILQIINCASDVVDETLVEIVLTGM